jgi:HEAT repeat protein
VVANEAVFLSYSCFETEVALQAAADLENAGFIVHTDATAPDARAGLLTSGVLVAFLSPGYLVARYAREELVLALRNRRTVIPVVVSPVQPAQLPANLPRQMLIDLTEWRDEPIYRERFGQLVEVLVDAGVTRGAAPEPEVRYLNSLIARLEMQRASLEYVDLSGEGEASDADTRPPSRTAEIWGIPTHLTLTHDGQRVVDIPLETALTDYPRLVLLGAPGSGKTTLLERLALDAASARRTSPSHHPIPLLLNLAEWSDADSIEGFIQANWTLEGDPLALLSAGRITLYLDGLNEMGAATGEKRAALGEWLRSENAPARVIAGCRTHDYNETLELPTLEIEDMDETAIERFVLAYVDQPAPLLAQLFPRSKEERENAYSLALLARRPALLIGLMFLYRSAAHTDLPRSTGALFKRLLAALWVWKRMAQMPMWLPFKEMEAGYSALALAMLDNDLPTSITRAQATQILRDERFIQAGCHAGLLVASGDRIRFAYKLLQEYFAAVGLNRVDLISRVKTPRFDTAGERLAGQWDQVIVMMAGIAANPDALIRDVAEIDPFLAGECVASGVRISDPVYDTVIHSLTSFAEDLATDGRMAATKALKAIGRKTIVPFLLELMRTGSWKARQSASRLLAQSGATVPPDLLKALRDWDWNMDDRVAGSLRRVGTDAVPVLLSVLHDEHWARRRGAAWALGAIGDAAAVPGLVETLHDSDALVRREAALALRVMSDDAAIVPLLEALRDDDWRVRKAAAETMISFKSAAVPGLVEALADKRQEVRRAGAEVLGRIGDHSALPPLLQLSHDADPELRGAAAAALGKMGSPDAIPRLLECLQDTARARFEERSICDLAADALEQIGTREAKAAVQAWRRGLPVESQVKPQPTHGKPGDSNVKPRLQQLIQGLFHPDWQRRVAAVEELSEIDEVPVVPALLKAIKDEDHQVRWAAVRALEGKPGDLVLKALLWALRDGAYLVSDAAAVALGRAGTSAIPGLLAALKDKNPDVRGRAVEALGKIGDSSVVPALAALLSDEATPRRETKRLCDLAAAVLEAMATPDALEALAQWRGLPVDAAPAAEPEQEPTQAVEPVTRWEALSHLLEALHNPNWGVRERAAKTMREQAKALRGLDDPIVVNLLAQALRDPDEFVRWAAVEALAWIKDDTTVPLLLEALHDKHWTVRLAVIRALIEIGDSNVTPALLETLNDQHTPLREAAAEALGRIGGPAALPGLLRALGDSDGFVRRAAAEALGDIGHVGAVPDLIRFLQDADAHVRWAAAEALGKIGDPAAVAPLAAKLNDSGGPSWEDRRICDVVADALESIGVPEAHAAVERWRNGSSLTYIGE